MTNRHTSTTHHGFSSRKVRLSRFLAADGRCLDVAIDHGVFNEYSFLDGLEDMPAVVQSLVAAGPHRPTSCP